MQDVTKELLGLRPPSWVLVPMVVETILHLVKMGRGSTAITAGMAGVYHVRLVASMPKRIERIREQHHFTRDEAIHFIEKEDRGSRRYVRAHFHARIEDDLMYHLVINTDDIPFEDAATLLAAGAQLFFQNSQRHPMRSRVN